MLSQQTIKMIKINDEDNKYNDYGTKYLHILQ